MSTAVTDNAPSTPPTAPTDEVLRIESLSVEFSTERGPVRVLEDVSLSIPRGGTLGLVGESGSGKTVTSLAVMGLLDRRISRVVSGQIWYGDTGLTSVSPREMRAIQGSEIAMIFQEARRSLDPVFTVGEQIAETVRTHEGVSRKDARKRAVEMLELVEIPDARRRAHAYPHELSGGMCQRVMLAAALAPRPSLLIADEPTTALDVTVQAQVLALLRTLQDEMALTILFITHDLGVMAETSDRVAVMYAGQVVEEGAVEQVFTRPSHPYTEGLIRSLPDSAAHKSRMIAIPGSVPPAYAWPTGCRFAARCSYSDDSCVGNAVPLTRHEDGAVRCTRSGELILEGIR
ncbi:ABC transporter ATP-binding protein [Rhodococcus sp. WAY2]|uniref:ABC transporter ATP-binding protein n=1 Tax=Rhodococcus sp. WAY2 TaxID=2663121 RepID=UPI00131F5319|nr:ABC transporter ATP-binding protein [Rhodococcus sp. WAY2]QHE73307.1 Oligopeptide transport system permease protein OppB [Rhodococcus sp. WAY2]